MSAELITRTVNGKSISCHLIKKGAFSIEVMPEQGFSLVSFQHNGRELLDQWDLKAFVGTPADVEFVSRNVTDLFRKGFGPSIGPWFGGIPEGSKAWNHGICRFADWNNIKTGDDFIRAHLEGSRQKLLSRTLDEICGFHLDVEIEYRLDDNGLIYSVINHSEGKKGTYGIHWYFKNPAGTKIALMPDMAKLPDLDPARFSREKDRVIADMGGPTFSQRFENRKSGLNESKGRVLYTDLTGLAFYFSDSFQYTTIFATKQALCFEPVSGPPFQVGTFTQGEIRIVPE